MSKYKFIIFSVLVSFVIDQQCTFGVNCPYNQGFCVDTKCECIEGYWSLMDKSLTPGQQIFCNYEQTNVYVPLILELLMPGTGHFYVGKYWFALIKLILLLTTLFGGYYFDKDLPIPNFICVLKDQFLTEQNLFEKKKASDGNDFNLVLWRSAFDECFHQQIRIAALARATRKNQNVHEPSISIWFVATI